MRKRSPERVSAGSQGADGASFTTFQVNSKALNKYTAAYAADGAARALEEVRSLRTPHLESLPCLPAQQETQAHEANWTVLVTGWLQWQASHNVCTAAFYCAPTTQPGAVLLPSTSTVSTASIPALPAKQLPLCPVPSLQTSRHAATRLQVGKFEEEHDTVVRSALRFKGSRVSVVTLVTFTGDRFLRSATADCTTGLAVPEEETEAAQAVVAMMEGKAPAEMDLGKLQQVLQTCRFFIADPLMKGFAPYLDGVASQLPETEVRSLPAAAAVSIVGI